MNRRFFIKSMMAGALTPLVSGSQYPTHIKKVVKDWTIHMSSVEHWDNRLVYSKDSFTKIRNNQEASEFVLRYVHFDHNVKGALRQGEDCDLYIKDGEYFKIENYKTNINWDDRKLYVEFDIIKHMGKIKSERIIIVPPKDRWKGLPEYHLGHYEYLPLDDLGPCHAWRVKPVITTYLPQYV